MEKDESKAGENGISKNRGELTQQVLKSGDSFGNFRVVKCLCAGLIANYYHMQHIRDLHDVTVAVFHRRTAKNVKFLKRLQTLQKMLKNLDHEGIPKIRDVTEMDNQITLFLDPIKGQSLTQYFNAEATPGKEGMGTETTTRIMAQLLGLLGYVHSHGLDHRDIDSDMIYIQEDGSIRLLGLGIKATLGTELFESIVSASVSPLSSAENLGRLSSFDVMSPEYKYGAPEDSRVDLYCSGVIGYWLLTGRKPVQAHLEKPSDYVEGLPSGWDSFLFRLLERDKEARFQSGKMALIALKEADGEPQSERVGYIQRHIDRIPVPKSIEARGSQATRIYRLSLIGLIGLTLTSLAAFFLQVTFSEENTYSKDIAQKVSDGKEAQLAILVQPPVSKVDFVGYDESFIVNNGRLELRVVPGNYRLRVTAPHHIEQTREVTVQEGRNVKQQQEVRIDLVPAWTDMKILSEPAAKVSVIDARGIEIELGYTDEEGVFLMKKGLFAGTYQIIVKKKGYEPKVLKDQELSFGKVSEINAPLKALPSTLTIQTNPPGAQILINEIEKGTSPLTIEDVAPDEKYLIVARLDNYRPAGRHVKLSAGQALVVDFGELVPKSGELDIEANFEGVSQADSVPLREEITVVLGGERFPLGSDQLKQVPEGDYEIRLEHPRYVSESIRFTLVDQEVEKLEFTLMPRPGEVKLVLPDKLEPSIRLNGKAIKVEGDSIAVPAFETVEFELRIRNYLTMVREFNLKPTEEQVWEVVPVPIPGPAEGKDWVVPYLGIKMAWIPAGRFKMGSPLIEQGRLPNEGDRTQVTFTKGFWAGIHEVTQAHYQAIMDQSPSDFKGPQRPVESVTWQEANRFCEILTRQEKEAGRLPDGYVYRLPTEAEWEYAARAGTTTPFHFGKTADATHGNFRGVYPRDFESGKRAKESYGTEPVGSYQPNAYGLYDIHGNVSEWTLDAYNGRLPGGSLVDPDPRTDSERFAVRGGSWEDYATRVRSAARFDMRMSTDSNALGFRVFLAPVK